MGWFQKYIPLSRTPHVHSPEQRGTSTPEGAVQHYLARLPGDTDRIQIHHVGALRQDVLFVYGGEWLQPPNHATLLLGYAWVEHQRSGWWVRHTTGKIYTTDSLPLAAYAKLSGSVLVYGRISTPTAATVEVVLNTGQTVCTTVMSPLFGFSVSHARSVRHIHIIEQTVDHVPERQAGLMR